MIRQHNDPVFSYLQSILCLENVDPRHAVIIAMKSSIPENCLAVIVEVFHLITFQSNVNLAVASARTVKLLEIIPIRTWKKRTTAKLILLLKGLLDASIMLSPLSNAMTLRVNLNECLVGVLEHTLPILDNVEQVSLAKIIARYSLFNWMVSREVSRPSSFSEPLQDYLHKYRHFLSNQEIQLGLGKVSSEAFRLELASQLFQLSLAQEMLVSRPPLLAATNCFDVFNLDLYSEFRIGCKKPL